MFSDEEIAEAYTDDAGYSGVSPRARSYFVDYPDYVRGFGFITRKGRRAKRERVKRPIGRPDFATAMVIKALTVRAMTGKELRAATSLKKTTVEQVLQRQRRLGRIARIPEEWNGPSANYWYALRTVSSDAVGQSTENPT